MLSTITMETTIIVRFITYSPFVNIVKNGLKTAQDVLIRKFSISSFIIVWTISSSVYGLVMVHPSRGIANH